jgi:4-methylaminobutanoate oxidase (formaldehyde-forming)
MTLPSHARVVIIGGGIIGCSVAYHLTRLGWSDVVLLEQGQLSGGTTWHAAGLVGQLRSHANMTGLIRYSTELYTGLEAETGLATGWKNCGSLAVARTEDRMTVLKRTAATARAQGVAVEVISAREAGDLWPVMETADLKGAVWLPGDGKANPTDLTQSLAKGARNRGARILERVRVTGITVKDGRACGVETDQGSIAAEIVVNCAGQWARKVGRMCGVAVPLHSAEHMYIVTGRIEGVHPDLPVLRDPDGFIYFKEEVGGLVMGGFEPVAKPWGMDGIPDDFVFSLLPDDWDQFEPLMENALIRVPQLGQAEVKKFYNGPESFTPDNNFILGEAPELKGFFVGAGFNSMGIASAGGAGRALAEWIVNGAPTMDLWPVDIRRFAPFNNNSAWLHDRVKETLGLHYAMPWPNRELDTARPLRRSPAYPLLKAKGACFGSKLGWERANWFAGPGGRADTDYSFGRQNWHGAVAEEVRATRERVAVFDQTSFGKLLVQGRDAAGALDRLCGAKVDVAPGRSVYTGMFNPRGGYESDLTVLRLDRDRFLLVTGSAQAERDRDWITRNLPDDAHVCVTDVTSAWAVLAVMGPLSRALLSRITPADLSNEAFPFATHRQIDLGYGTGIANRMTYVGELGWELIVPTEFAAGIYEALFEKGVDLGVADAGYYALESMRLEKGFRAWSRELTPDITPAEAGLMFAVAADKSDFIGREAIMAARAGTPRRHIVQVTLDDAGPVLWGGEAVLRDGRPVGELRSAGHGHTLGRSVGLALIEHDAGVSRDFLATGRWEVDLAGARHAATLHLKAAYDPTAERVRL